MAIRKAGAERRARQLRVIAALVILSLFGIGLSVLGENAPARAAAPTSAFDPGYIISDYEFYDKTAMSQADIQTFLNKECPTNDCINSFGSDVNTNHTDPTNMCPGGYAGGDHESTAEIIYRVEQSCGISAKVILVTLQKEQGLVTARNPSSQRRNAAMGYGCPDTSGCDTLYSGLFNQIYDAASQFVRYGLRTSDNISFRTKFQIGVPYPIAYAPAGRLDEHGVPCATQTVTVRNKATTALYYYTPYTPDPVALATTGLGDNCSSYGNRNFWLYYNEWFGSTTTTVPPSVTSVARDGGEDRFGTAVAVSRDGYPTPGVPVVYVANGLDYPDALTAGPAAAKQGGPLLLVEPTSIPPEVLAELQRLRPQKIVVVGGTSAVSDAVYTELSGLVPAATPSNITRVGGADRYETARDLAAYAFGTSTQKAFIATGANFADALAASAAAGSQGAPIVLVNDSASSADAATTNLLATMGITKLVFVGGTASISASLASSLGAVPGITATTRYGGLDRYETSYLLNAGEFPSASKIYLSVGTNYPDALAGAALAGAQHAPLYIVQQSCVPSHVLEDFLTYSPTTMVMLGGTAALSANVGAFVGC
jgi:putative cell wall-binding protein